MSLVPPVTKDIWSHGGDLHVEASGHNRHRRATIPELRALYDGSAGAKDPPAHRYEAQLLHYGLPPSKVKGTAKMRLFKAVSNVNINLSFSTGPQGNFQIGPVAPEPKKSRTTKAAATEKPKATPMPAPRVEQKTAPKTAPKTSHKTAPKTTPKTAPKAAPKAATEYGFSSQPTPGRRQAVVSDRAAGYANPYRNDDDHDDPPPPYPGSPMRTQNNGADDTDDASLPPLGLLMADTKLTTMAQIPFGGTELPLDPHA
ncbi:hypothetical protein B0H63DRAFT_545853 [Podospora didyma]|uniref:Uncharacterized protein n=1 Tax=Podospora didyma TaxID=330526 RepID=A0AAE0NGW4_9PEZI|nr:hypothetical protein B0H63DRAFT_545853 [Podospora didyma]